MTSEEARLAETNACIVDRLEQGLAETKHCRTEQQRQQYHIGLGFAAPARDSGMIARIGRRLKMHCGARKKGAGEERGRPYAFEKAIDCRERFDSVIVLQAKSLQPGDTVLSHGDTCSPISPAANHNIDSGGGHRQPARVPKGSRTQITP